MGLKVVVLVLVQLLLLFLLLTTTTTILLPFPGTGGAIMFEQPKTVSIFFPLQYYFAYISPLSSNPM